VDPRAARTKTSVRTPARTPVTYPPTRRAMFECIAFLDSLNPSLPGLDSLNPSLPVLDSLNPSLTMVGVRAAVADAGMHLNSKP